jgi:hypothetical protein
MSNHLNNYLNDLDGYSGQYESLQGAPSTTLNNPNGSPLQKNALQPAAQFTLRITRLTANIAGNLPVALFGGNRSAAQYINDLSIGLPAATSFDGVVGGLTAASLPSIALADRLQFSYTSGAGTDLLQVECDENPYPEILAASTFTPMVINTIRMGLSDETKNAQFNLGIKAIRSSTFGKETKQTIVPQTQKSPMQFQAGIVDLVDFPSVIDAQTYFIMPVLPEAGFAISLSFNVQAFSRPLQA